MSQALQRELADWLVDPESSRDFARERGIDPARLQVHRNTFVGTLVEALAESFPVTRALAGADFFDAMARTRVLADPPRTPVLTEYAYTFPAWIVDFEPAQDTPVLASMAQLEALRLRAFHAADATALGPVDFQPLASEPARLETTTVRLHPAAHWFPARQPVLSLWLAHEQAEDPAAVDLTDIDPRETQDVLVHRPGLALRMQLLPPGAVEFLDALAAGCSLAVAFAEAAAARADGPAALFSLLLRGELVVELLPLPEHAR